MVDRTESKERQNEVNAHPIGKILGFAKMQNQKIFKILRGFCRIQFVCKKGEVGVRGVWVVLFPLQTTTF